jgi:hypothetical protein
MNMPCLWDAFFLAEILMLWGPAEIPSYCYLKSERCLKPGRHFLIRRRTSIGGALAR